MKYTEFSTSVVTPQYQFEAWRDALFKAFGPMEITRHPRDKFSGYIKTFSRSQLQFNDIQYSGQTIERTAGNLAQVSEEYFTLGRPISGPLYVEQKKSSFAINPGYLILANQCYPYKASATGQYRALSLSIPKRLLTQREPNIGPIYKLEITPNCPRVMLLVNFLKYFEEGINEWSEIETISLREQLLDLIVLLMVNGKSKTSPASETSIKSAHRERALAFLKHHHRNPDLGPQAIAEACGISTNYLHKVFRNTDQQVVDLIYAHRLETAKNLLLDAESRERTIQQIAYSSGFNHASHFSRMFKEKFGISPIEFRLSRTASAASSTATLREIAA